MNKRHLISSLLGIALAMLSLDSLAEAIKVYEQPNANSKMVAAFDSSTGIITIFTPKGSDWIKVADPRNGNVGWIKSSDLGHSNMSINIITTSNGPNGYQIIQFGNIKHFTTEQIQTAVKKIELQQQSIQKQMQKMMQDILNNSHWRFPLMMPAEAAPAQTITPGIIEPVRK